MSNLKNQAVLIAGATSAIARALAARLAAEGATLYLAGRDAAEIQRIAADLDVRYQASVSWGRFEAEDYSTHAVVVDEAIRTMGRLDGVVVSVGQLGEQPEAEADFEHAQRIIHSNYTGAASLLAHAANHLEAQRHGFIVGISSVAGDRGRQSNYVYGSAKGALSLFLQGLRNRLHGSDVHVLTVKPGFVDTKMTFGKPNLFLVARPQQVASDILNALNKKKAVLYTPWFWRWIMVLIRTIPEPLFKRLSL